MKAVVVDSNIVFSALLKRGTRMRAHLTDHRYKFYAPNYLIVAIFKHIDRILEMTTADEATTLEYVVISYVRK